MITSLIYFLQTKKEKIHNKKEQIYNNATQTPIINPQKVPKIPNNNIYLPLTKNQNSISILNDYIIFEVLPTKKASNEGELNANQKLKYFYDNEGKIISLQYYNRDGSDEHKCDLIYNKNDKIKEKKCYLENIYDKKYTYTYNELGQIIVKEEENPQSNNNFKYEYNYNNLNQLTTLQQYFPDGVKGLKFNYVYQSSN
ncbi:hypothetical protein [Candidatus Phytoplasma australiense]|uniref:hypothetical protein n=1 Tax=Phytoplasma australiense TaxID=59748 RepID=UPI001F426FA0|nr:hypothetical protein [Candidatus Phytoplasma australiense]